MWQIAGGIVLATLILAFLPHLIRLAGNLLAWGFVLFMCCFGGAMIVGVPVSMAGVDNTAAVWIGAGLGFVCGVIWLSRAAKKDAAALAEAQAQYETAVLEQRINAEALVRARADILADEMRARAADRNMFI